MKVVHTSGKRKTAIARGTVREGTGKVRINKVPIELYSPELARLKLTEPLEYKWWHSEDSLIWTEIPGTSVSLSLASVGQSEAGWYKVAVAGAGSISSVNCRSISEPFKLSVKECEPPEPAEVSFTRAPSFQ